MTAEVWCAIAAVLAAGMSVPSAMAQVSIVQVLYDPVGTESGGEFVLLENKGNATANIGGWMLETSASAKDVVLPKEAAIEAGKTFLIADKGWDTLRDNLSWPMADLEEIMTLGNEDSGVALTNTSGTVMDAVGWGNVSNPRLFKGRAARHVEAGRALQRVLYTGSNADDFREALPQFKTRDRKNEVELELTVTAPPSGRLNISVSVEDDDALPGIQLFPFPGAVRMVRVNVSWRGSQPELFIVNVWGVNVTKRLQPLMQGSSGVVLPASIEVWVNLSYQQLPGNYSLDVAAQSGNNTLMGFSRTVAVLPVVSISLDAGRMSLGNASAGSIVVLRGDADPQTPERPTVWNSGNVPAVLSVSGSGLRSGAETIIESSFIDVALRRVQQSASGFPYEGGAPVLQVGESAGLDISVTIPQVSPGTFRGKVWLTASAGENGRG